MGWSISRRWRAFLLGAATTLALSATSATHVHASLKFWDGGGANNNWSNPNNWNTMFGGAPLNDGTDDIIMQGTVRLTPLIDINYDINSLLFNSTAGAFAFQAGGQDLSIRGGGITNNDADLQIISRMSLGANHTWNAAAGPLQVNFVTLGGLSSGRMLTVSGTFDTSIQGSIGGSVITNAGSIVLNSTANFTLAGLAANTFTGPITVNSGTLLLNKTAGINAVPGNLIIGDGVGSDVVKLVRSNQIADAANVTINSSGLFDLTGGTETIANLTMNGGAIDVGAGGAAVTGATILNSSSIVVSTGTAHFSGGVTMTAGSIGGANAHVELDADSAIIASTTTALLRGADVHFGGGSLQQIAVPDGAAADDLEISGAATGTVTKTGGGQLRFAGGGTGSLTLNANAGTVVLQKTSGPAVRNLRANGGVVRFEGANQVNNSMFCNSAGLIDMNGFSTTVADVALAGGRIETGGGTLWGFSVSAPFDNQRAVIDGTLRLYSPGFGFTPHVDVGGGLDDVQLELAGSVRSEGAWNYDGSPTAILMLSGTTANDFPLVTIPMGGTMLLAKSVPDAAVPHSVSVAQGTVRLAANEQIGNSPGDVVTLRSSAAYFDLDGFNETVRDLSLNGGKVTTGTGGELTVLGGVDVPTVFFDAGPALLAGSFVLPSGSHPFTAANSFPGVALDLAGNFGGPGTMVCGPGSGVVRMSGHISNPVILQNGNLLLAADNAIGSSLTVLGGNLAPEFDLGLDCPITLLGPLTFFESPGFRRGGPGSAELLHSGPLNNANGQTISKRGASMLTLAGPQSHGLGSTIQIFEGAVALLGDAGAGSGANLTINVSGNTAPGVPPALLRLASTQHLASLNVNLGAATLDSGGQRLIVTKSLVVGSVNALLDVWEHAILVDYSGATPLPSIRSAIVSARNGGAWNGFGITSSAAAIQSTHNTTLGLMEGSDYRSIYGSAAMFEGEPVDATAVLVKYTYYGDTDFNELVNFDDYSRIDNGFNSGGTDWLHGDFDYNGVVNFDDYSLIDLAFNSQNGTLARATSYLDGGDRNRADMKLPALAMVRDHFDRFGEVYAQGFLNSVPEPAMASVLIPALLLRRRSRLTNLR